MRAIKGLFVAIGLGSSLPALADIWADLQSHTQRYDQQLLRQNANNQSLMTSQTLVSATSQSVMYLSCVATGAGDKRLRCRMVEYAVTPIARWTAEEWRDVSELGATRAMSAASPTLAQDFSVYCHYLQSGYDQTVEQVVRYDQAWRDMLQKACQNASHEKTQAFLQDARRYQDNLCYARPLWSQELRFRQMAANAWGSESDDCDRELVALSRDAQGKWQMARRVRPLASQCDPSLNDDKLSARSDRWVAAPLPSVQGCGHMVWKETEARHELANAEKTPANEKMEASLEQALLGLKDRRYQQALQLTNRVIKKDPSRWYAYMLRSMAYDGLGKDFEAGDDLGTALRTQVREKTPVGDSAANLLIILHAEYRLRHGQGVAVLPDLDSVLRANPNSYQAVLKRAKALAQAKRYPEAIAAYRQGIGMISAFRRLFAIELDAVLDRYQTGSYFTSNAEALNELARLLLTVPEPSLQNPALALKFAGNASRRAGGKDIRFIETMAMAEAKLGHPARAERRLSRAMTRLPLKATEKKRLALQIKAMRAKRPVLAAAN